MTSRSDELLMGTAMLLIAPWALWTIVRGVRAARLPIGRGYVERAERPGAFNALLAFYGASALLLTLFALDLLFQIRESLGR